MDNLLNLQCLIVYLVVILSVPILLILYRFNYCLMWRTELLQQEHRQRAADEIIHREMSLAKIQLLKLEHAIKLGYATDRITRLDDKLKPQPQSQSHVDKMEQELGEHSNG